MASLNKVILIGNLGADPESRNLPSGDPVCNLRLATTEKWRDKGSGEMREATEWHRVAFFGRQAEVAAQYLRKGSQVYVEGRIQTRKWTDQSGQERYSTEIRGDELKMLGRRGESTGEWSGPASGGGASSGAPRDDEYPDDGGFASPPRREAPRAPAAESRPRTPVPDLPEDDVPF